ncbi:hypothetical protein IAI10_20560 [Clostridium sp. 19966]|uniref:hypothetical protein n=1 Tax=Clostridium sp. 19966 TaxID=2768166 RepID=UPI0028E02194|nr:hypothetical protein [Clostridium sp. 19966]MDT8719045.1 hypothetical protein [Clostridium sp. 19966]
MIDHGNNKSDEIVLDAGNRLILCIEDLMELLREKASDSSYIKDKGRELKDEICNFEAAYQNSFASCYKEYIDDMVTSYILGESSNKDMDNLHELCYKIREFLRNSNN